MCSSEFDIELFEQRLTNLKDTQEGIQQMSSWCLQQRSHHKKIVSSWLNVLKQVRVEHRLTLFYLANDVIQYSKRKNYEFVESWGTTLQKATTMVRDEKVRHKIFRIFKIWEQREIYAEDFLGDLNGLLSVNPVKKTQPSNNTDSGDDFQNSVLVASIRNCVKLQTNTDKYFKQLPRTPNCDTETIKYTLKDRSNSEDITRELNTYLKYLEGYVKSLKLEILSRKSLMTHLENAETFYKSQRGEVKVVVNAYKNFGNRIKIMKKKLNEVSSKLPSPIPSPDIDAPSPEQDADIILPDEQYSLNSFIDDSSNGFSSYMNRMLPFDIKDFKCGSPKSEHHNVDSTTRPIEVINSRPKENSGSFDTSDFFKSSKNSSTYRDERESLSVTNVSSFSVTKQPSNTVGSPAPNYRSHAESYLPNEVYANNNSFLPINSSYQTNIPLMPPPPIPPGLGSTEDDFNSTWTVDIPWNVDHTRKFSHQLASPVSPAYFEQNGLNHKSERRGDIIIGGIKDVDHRRVLGRQEDALPTTLGKDIDHRNLISLTGSPGTNKDDLNIRKGSLIGQPDEKRFALDRDYRMSLSPVMTKKISTTQLKPPPLPPHVCGFLETSSPNYDTTMPPQLLQGQETCTSSTPNKDLLVAKTLNKTGLKSNNASDNNESIDMELSDEDLEAYSRDDLCQPSESTDRNNSSYEINPSHKYTHPESLQTTEVIVSGKPLLQSPELPQQQWDQQETFINGSILSKDGTGSNLWRTPRDGNNSLPQFRENTGFPFSSRQTNPFSGPMPQQHRNFSPQTKQTNHRGIRGVNRNTPAHLCNRGRGSVPRGAIVRPFRFGFRGKDWQ